MLAQSAGSWGVFCPKSSWGDDAPAQGFSHEEVELEYQIQVSERDTTRTIETDGYLLLYFDSGKVKSTGSIELKALTPLLTKLLLEKIS